MTAPHAGPDLSWVSWATEDMTKEAQKAIAAKRAALSTLIAIPDTERSFKNTIEALEIAGELSADTEQTLQFLMNVHTDPTVREAAQVASSEIDEANVAMLFDPALYRAATAWESTGERAGLTGAEAKLADDTLRDLRRMGFALPPEQFEELKRNRVALKKLEDAFEKGINDWDDGIEVSEAQLDGLPESYREGLTRTTDGRWRVSLQYPDFFPYMKLAHDEPSRRELMRRNLRKGGPENMGRLAAMIRLRQRNAELLGYATHAAFVTEARMARTQEAVTGFLESIARKLMPASRGELRDLIALKTRILGLGHPKPIGLHEMAYWSNRLRRERYDFDSEELKQYFPLTTVLTGMMDLYAELFGLRFKKISADGLWHADAQLFEAADRGSGSVLGHFFLDLHPRAGKYGHAAAFPIQLGRNGRNRGIVALVCNFPKATPSNPSLLSHQDVETLFHEFGHLVHALLSCGTRYGSQNGLSAAMDFVEAPSQLLEEWSWNPAVLARVGRHHATGETIPDSLVGKLLASRHHMDANYFLAQVVYALYDLRMHGQPTAAPVEASHLAQLYRDLELEYRAMDVPDDSLKAAGWSHLADYDAAYYGYLWSKVYALDLYTRFAADPLDAVVGAEYRHRVLEPGASRKEIESIREFLGRDPSDTAFLAALGIQ